MGRNARLHAAVAFGGRPVYVLCAEARVAPSTWAEIAAGRKTPTPEVAHRIAAALGVPVEDIFPELIAETATK